MVLSSFSKFSDSISQRVRTFNLSRSTGPLAGCITTNLAATLYTPKPCCGVLSKGFDIPLDVFPKMRYALN